MLKKGMILLTALLLCLAAMGAQAEGGAVAFDQQTQTQTEIALESEDMTPGTWTEGSEGESAKAADGDWSLSLDFGEEDELPEEVKAIFGTDERVVVSKNKLTSWPYRAVVYVESTYPNGKTYGGTGFMIGPSYVLTNGHCVYNAERGGFAKEIIVIPAHSGNVNPYGTTSSTWVSCMNEWYYDMDFRYDLGLIKTKDPIGNKTGWLGYYYPEDYELDDYVRIIGYGEDSDYMYEVAGYLEGTDNDKYQQQRDEDRINNFYALLEGRPEDVRNSSYGVSDARIRYNIDTLPGSSGSPILKNYNGDTGYAIGVNNSHNSYYNYAVRFTKKTVDFFKNYHGK